MGLGFGLVSPNGFRLDDSLLGSNRALAEIEVLIYSPGPGPRWPRFCLQRLAPFKRFRRPSRFQLCAALVWSHDRITSRHETTEHLANKRYRRLQRLVHVGYVPYYAPKVGLGFGLVSPNGFRLDDSLLGSNRPLAEIEVLIYSPGPGPRWPRFCLQRLGPFKRVSAAIALLVRRCVSLEPWPNHKPTRNKWSLRGNVGFGVAGFGWWVMLSGVLVDLVM